MTVTSSPHGEHAGRTGQHWDTEVVSAGEQYVPECTASIRGFCLAEAQSEPVCDTDVGECIYSAPMPSFTPAANREKRRAIEQRARRTK